MGNEPQLNFLDRLKRHYIFRVAAIYAIGSWVVIQLFNNVLPNLGLPKDSVRFVIIIVALGFPVVLVLAWTFINPRGVGHTEPSHWTRLRLRVGSLLSFIIIILVSISGWYLWKAAVVAHVAQLVTEASPVNTPAAFDPLPRSIAVLPFNNQSNNPSQQYFSDGITQEITGDLGALPGVSVISWQSTSSYRGKQISPAQVGRALNVANILVGSIRRDGDRVRISTELVDTVTGYQLWSARYDRKFKDVFAIQDDISKALVSALKLHLPIKTPIVTVSTSDADAHDAYLKGLAELDKSTPDSLNDGIQYFQRAIRLDPKYAEAYASLASTYAAIHQFTNVPLDQSLPLAKRAAKQALRLNSNLASAHAALGMVYALQQKTIRARAELRRAIELDPNNASAHIIYATLLPTNKYKEALAQYQRAVTLDPNNAFAHYNLGVTYENSGDYKNAITEFQATLGLAPQLTFTRLDLANLYHLNSDDKSAVDIVSGVSTDDPQQSQLLDAARMVYMAQQNHDLHNQALTALRQIDASKMSTSDKQELVTLYALVGENTYALNLLKQVCKNAPENCADLEINPSYQKLQNEPEFKKMIKIYSLNN